VDTYADLPTTGVAEGDFWLAGGNLYRYTASGWPAEDAGTPMQGPQGPVGDTGPQGPAGSDGADGASAYEVAVAAGFSGTQAAWLSSLVGPQGPKGDTGAQGPTGAQGVQGQAGVSLDIEGAVNTYADLATLDPAPTAGQAWVNKADGKLYYYDATAGFPADGLGVPFQGEQGPEGPQGIQGPAGTDGASSWADIADKPTNLVTGYSNGTPVDWKLDVLSDADYLALTDPDPTTVYFRLGS
jgi:hypothetical protein